MTDSQDLEGVIPPEDKENIASQEPSEPCLLSRRDRRRAETRERIFDAAMKLLSEREFESITVETITEAADVGKGTFFNYFKNKEAIVGYYFEKQLALLQEAIDSSSEKLAVSLQPIANGYGENAFWYKMQGIMRYITDRDFKNRRLTRTLLTLALGNNEVRHIHIAFHTRIRALLRSLVEDSQQSQELRDDVLAENIVEYIMNIHLGAFFYWAQRETDETLFEAFHRAYSFCLTGISAYATQPSASEGKQDENDQQHLP